MPQASIPKRASTPKRPISTTLTLVAVWFVFYASFTLFTPALLDDADSVHAEVAREMLLRHDWVTLYANGIRYLEKAPLLYWTMATSMGLAQFAGQRSAAALAVAARIPLALTVLALALAVEGFARRAFRSPERESSPERNKFSPERNKIRPEQDSTGPHTGLYAALILLSSFGLFLFTRITIPDAMLCLWLTVALYAFYQTEQSDHTALEQHSFTTSKTRVILSGAKNPCISPEAPHMPVHHSSQAHRDEWDVRTPRLPCFAFAACCALGVLTKGLIGLLFPIAIVAIYLALTRGLRGAIARIRQLHPLTSTAVFLAIAAPWHILIALANSTQGHPGGVSFSLHPAAGAAHWHVPLPTDGNVHGWAWFYFVNEQVLRYLNLRVPHDYDTVPLWLFLGLILIWLMPWSAFLFKALSYSGTVAGNIWSSISGSRLKKELHRRHLRSLLAAHNPLLLLTIWAFLPLLFFSFSTRQEYYVLPSLPALAILIAAWLARDSHAHWQPITDGAQAIRRANLRCTAVLVALGAIFAAATIYFLLHAHTPAPNADLAALLQQNPSDYAMSMGHFLDLNAQALGLFRLPLAIAAISLLLGPLASYLLRRRARPHAATLTLAAGAFGFLLAAHLGLRTFAPVLSSQQLAAAIAQQIAAHPDEPPPLIVIHQEYEYGSTLGFYLQQPSYTLSAANPSQPRAKARPEPQQVLHILTDAEHDGTPNYGRSSNLWYGSFFPDAPPIFETAPSLAAKWPGPQRIFLWQDLANDPSPPPALLTPSYVIATSGGKEILSNQPSQ
jgi:4-amino-4-deoxy-L-arabinose transferase-like glycosyltransferase